MTDIRQKIVPNLWFDRQAEEAAAFYVAAFGDGRIGKVLRAGRAGRETHGLAEGAVLTVEFEVRGHTFIGLNGGPLFTFNPSVSFLVACRTPAEVDDLWAKIAAGGAPLMELGAYPFSERYGWVADKYGLSWQIMAMGDRPVRQRIVPTLMFVGAQAGRCEEAVRLYTALFRDSRTGEVMRYGKGEEPDREGTIRHAGFTLEGQEFAAMDSAYDHKFAFNEAVSLMVVCGSQAEIDRHWAGLLAGGGEESMCGWLKDRFGVSWQVTPAVLDDMLRDPDPDRVARVTNAFLKMRKFDIAALERAHRGE